MQCDLSTLTVDIFNALDAARCLHVKMTSVFAQKIRIIWHDPTAVDVGIEFVVALDPFKHRPMFGATVHGVVVSGAAVNLPSRALKQREPLGQLR